MEQKLYILANARIPNKKAYAIQIAKMCEAFIENGHAIELVIPRTHASRQLPFQDYYRLRVDVSVRVVGGLDWYSGGKIPFALGSLVYMVSSIWYLWREKWRGMTGIVFVVDMDSFSYMSLLFGPFPYAIEIDRMPATWLNRMALWRSSGIVCINREVRTDVLAITHLPPGLVIDSPNGVDPTWFEGLSKAEARRMLKIPADDRIALFVGRFWRYKGIEIFIDAAKRLTSTRIYLVGGTKEEFMKELDVHEIPSALHVAGECQHNEVPTWLAAADALVMVGDKGHLHSGRYFSPLKIFEYMAADRPVIAADVPAIRAVVPDSLALWYESGNGEDLAQKIEYAVTESDEVREMAHKARETARSHTWAIRAREIFEFMQSNAAAR